MTLKLMFRSLEIWASPATEGTVRVKFLSVATTLAAFITSSAQAMENPIGSPQIVNGMEVSAVYLQPIEMEPAGMMAPATESDIHLEADIHATAENENGFAEGDWLPNLVVSYQLTKEGDPKALSGMLMPMVASDGPHYGDNVKLMGPGRYRLKLLLSAGDTHHAFGRHVDKETGVKPWPAPSITEFQFVYAGTGKKGGY